MNSTRRVAAEGRNMGMQNEDPDKPTSGGEFTRLFRGLEPAGKPPSPEPPTPAGPTAAIPATRPLTKMFTAKAQPQRPEHAPSPPAFEPKIGPGEFTRMFGAPPVTPPPSVQPPAPPPGREASFTEVFNVPQFSAPTEKPVAWKEAESRAAQPSVKKEPSSAWGAASFEAPIIADEFAKVIAGSRPGSAAAQSTSPSSPTPETPAKKLPPLWLPVALICSVLILAALAIYWFVVRP